jgi:hypothetical protein
MSLTTIPNLLERIAVASKDSPIAVFRTPGPVDDRLDAIFASTYWSQRIIKSNPINLIGVYTCNNNPDELRSLFKREIKVDAI